MNKEIHNPQLMTYIKQKIFVNLKSPLKFKIHSQFTHFPCLYGTADIVNNIVTLLSTDTDQV